MRYTDVNYIPRYVQAKNITKEMKRILFPLGSRILFLMGCGPIEEAMMEKIDYSFSHSMSEAIQDNSPAAAVASRLAQYYDSMNRPMAYQYVKTDGLETTSENAEKLWNKNKTFNPDVIVGVGGGENDRFGEGGLSKSAPCQNCDGADEFIDECIGNQTQPDL